MPKLFSQPYVQRLAQLGGTETVLITLVDDADGVTLIAGHAATPTVQISKAGAAFGSCSDGVWAEVGNGIYTVRLNKTDKNTLGPLLVRVIAATPTTYETQALCWVGVNNEDEVGVVQRIRTIHREVQTL